MGKIQPPTTSRQYLSSSANMPCCVQCFDNAATDNDRSYVFDGICGFTPDGMISGGTSGLVRKVSR